MPKRIPLVKVDLAEDIPRARITAAALRLRRAGEITAEDTLRLAVFGPKHRDYWLPKEAVDRVIGRAA